MSNIFTKTVFLTLALCLTSLFSGCGYINNASPKSPTPTPTTIPNSSAQTPSEFEQSKTELTKLPTKVQLVKDPYITGKLMAYERQTKFGEKPGEWRKYDNFGYTGNGFNEKFSNLHPSSPDEVKTVILNDCQQIKSATFEIDIMPGVSSNKNVPAYGWKCELTLVDRSIPAVVYRKTFLSDTKKTVSVKSENVQKIELDRPMIEIKEFVENLTVR